MRWLSQTGTAQMGRVVMLTVHQVGNATAQFLDARILDHVVLPLESNRFDDLLEHAAVHATSRLCNRGTTQRCGDLLSQAASMNLTFFIIRRVASLQYTVLLHGESDTGKELAARGVHQYSGLTGKFVAFNCGTLSGELAASQLFGHDGAVSPERSATMPASSSRRIEAPCSWTSSPKCRRTSRPACFAYSKGAR